jgi:hypothetical protein
VSALREEVHGGEQSRRLVLRSLPAGCLLEGAEALSTAALVEASLDLGRRPALCFPAPSQQGLPGPARRPRTRPRTRRGGAIVAHGRRDEMQGGPLEQPSGLVVWQHAAARPSARCMLVITARLKRPMDLEGGAELPRRLAVHGALLICGRHRQCSSGMNCSPPLPPNTRDAWRARTDAVPPVERHRSAAAGVGLGDGLEVVVSLIPQRESCACPRRAARSTPTAAPMSEATGRRRTRGFSLVTWAILGCTR